MSTLLPKVLRVKSRLRRDFKPVDPENSNVQTGFVKFATLLSDLKKSHQIISYFCVCRYRDVIVNMRAAPHMGLGDHIFEVQLHLTSFFEEQPNGGARILRMSVFLLFGVKRCGKMCSVCRFAVLTRSIPLVFVELASCT